ncbi:MAG: flagellar biosynthetic protein FliQ, partial [Candidatus Sumerlaeota bacterium]
ALFLAGPSLISALLVGVAVSVFQSVTSIQEQTLIFVPKMLAVMLALVIFFSWMQAMAIQYTQELIRNIPGFIG